MIMKIDNFQKFYLIVKILSLVSHLCYFIMILRNRNIILRM